MNLPVTLSFGLPLLAALCLFTLPAPTSGQALSPQSTRADFYVSPQGKDTWSGTMPAPNKEGTDGPFATPGRARDALRALPKNAPHAVLLRGGFYPLGETLVLTAEDSGMENAPVTWAAYPGETPILSGGDRVTGWKKVTNGVYRTTIPEVAARRRYFSQFYVNEGRRYRPRLPKSGYAFVAADLPPSPASGGKGFDQFRYHSGDFYTSWRNRGDVEVLPFHIWTMSRFHIADLDPATQTVRFSGHTPGAEPYFRIPQGGRYLIENVAEALSNPGDWYLDRATGVLTYLARSGEDLTKEDKFAAYAPRLEHLLTVSGAQHIVFRGITFAHSGWNLPPEGYSYPQAEIAIPAAITLTDAANVSFRQCTVRNTGNWAVHFAGATHDCTLDGCELRDLGAGGVKLGETTYQADENKLARHNTVRDCLIAEGGRVHPAAIGVWLGHTPYNTIEHNEIVDFYYTGISVGWSWGYGPSGCHHNTIAYNHIHRIGQGVLSDMGGIYTLGLSPGTVLHHNLIHDIAALEYGGWGIYFDEGTTGMVAENNVVYNTKSAPFHQHYGKENVVRNNVLAFGQEAQLMRTRAEDHLSFTLSHNIVYYREGPLLGSNWTGNQFRLEDNLYWNAAGQPVTFAGKTLAEWKAQGFDTGSLVADPLFVAPEKGDFTLKLGSPAEKIGFQPIDLKTVGRLTGKPYTGNAPMAFPPPPPPQPIEDGFEETPVGAKPGLATVNEEPEVPAANIRVTDETAATGKHSLKFTDAPGQKQTYNPHLYYRPKFDSGRVAGTFALRWEMGAEFFHEWRDGNSPYTIGPSLRVNGQGELYAGNRKLADLPRGQWVRFEITCTLGEKADGKWDLTVRLPGRVPPLRFRDLPCGSGTSFRQIRWWGFVANATTSAVFYLDDISLNAR